MTGETVYAVFLKGGIMMWPLLLCSVVGLGVIVERMIYFFGMRYDRKVFEVELVRILERGDVEKAIEVSKKHRHPVAKVVQAYLENLERKEEVRRGIIMREGTLALAGAEQRIRVVATVAHVSPFMGLLGTVLGMVAAFATIESLENAVQPSQLAGGIWEALLTTVFGLMIAIPCVIMLQYFHSRVDRMSRNMDAAISQLDEWNDRRLKGVLKG